MKCIQVFKDNTPICVQKIIPLLASPRSLPATRAITGVPYKKPKHVCERSQSKVTPKRTDANHFKVVSVPTETDRYYNCSFYYLKLLCINLFFLKLSKMRSIDFDSRHVENYASESIDLILCESIDLI